MILLSILGVAYVFPQLGRTPPRDRSRLDINYYNAPEGTAYVDILVKTDSSDENYTEFNAVPQELTYSGNDMFLTDGDPLDIDENSEIARYNEDGYMSLSLHSADVWFFDLNKNKNNHLMLHCNFHDLYKKYGEFKLAYVGEHGEVLGVTKKASHRYDSVNESAIVADGDNATYREWFDISHLTSAAILILFLTFPVMEMVSFIKNINQKNPGSGTDPQKQ
jgi:hypothetical protein